MFWCLNIKKNLAAFNQLYHEISAFSNCVQFQLEINGCPRNANS